MSNKRRERESPQSKHYDLKSTRLKDEMINKKLRNKIKITGVWNVMTSDPRLLRHTVSQLDISTSLTININIFKGILENEKFSDLISEPPF